MKRKEDVNRLLNLIDDDLIIEADPSVPYVKQRGEGGGLKIGTLLIILSAILLVGILVLVPILMNSSNTEAPGDTGSQGTAPPLDTDTEGSAPQKPSGGLSGEYTPIIDGLDKLFKDGVTDILDKGYIDTDLTVDGVVKGDMIARGSKYLYYINGTDLHIYTLDEDNSKIVGLFSLDKTLEYIGSQLNRVEGVGEEKYESKWELYLSSSERVLTLVGSSYEKYSRPCVSIISLDISNPSSVSVKKTVNILGHYVTSRVVGDEVLVFTSYLASGEEKGYIPQIDTGNGFEYLKADKITYPQSINSPRYLVASRINVSTLRVNDTVAYLSYSSMLHITDKNVYVTHSIKNISTASGVLTSTTKTELSCIGFDTDTFTKKGSVVLEGEIEGQYAFSETDTHLRVLTTSKKEIVDMANQNSRVEYSLNAYSLLSLSLTPSAHIEGFAASDRAEITVRFKDNLAYVYLTEAGEEIAYVLDFGEEIACEKKTQNQVFSSTLISFCENYLLGYDKESSTVKLYEATEGGTGLIATYTLNSYKLSSSYKSLYINSQIGLIGIGYINDEGEGGYLLLSFNGIELVEIINVSLDGENDTKRALYKDGYFYMVSEKQFVVRYIENKLVSTALA